MIDASVGVLVAVASLVVLVALILGAVVVRIVRKKDVEDELFGVRDLENNKWLNLPPLVASDSNSLSKSTNIQPSADKHRSFLGSVFKRKKPDIVIDSSPQEASAGYLGKINFGLSFDKQAQTLAVHVIQAADLPVKDICGSSDPYVRLFLLPDLNVVKATRVHRRNLAPAFNQTVVFTGYTMKKLQDMVLCMQIMDYDRFTRDDPIGEILLPLKSVNNFANCPVYWKNLKQPTVHKEPKGELMLSLCYLPQSNKVTCVVVKAKDLPAKDVTGYSDPYVKLWLLQEGAKVEKKKTTVKSQTMAPVYNESFTFVVSPDKMDETQLVASVMDYDMLKSNEDLGFVVLGTRGNETGKQHWMQMLSRPGYPVGMWHPLQPKW